MSGFTENTVAYPVGCWEENDSGGCLCVECFDAGNGSPYSEHTALPKSLGSWLYRVGSVIRVETRCQECGKDVEGWIA